MKGVHVHRRSLSFPALLLPALLCACMRPNPLYCDSSIPCPSGQFCSATKSCVEAPGAMDGSVDAFDPMDAQSACASASDCPSGVCVDRQCRAATCSDGVKNGGETDVDCGGLACQGCAQGKACVQSSDCDGALCSANRSCQPALSCYVLHAALPQLPSGTYTISPGSASGDTPFPVYCDMTSANGGWTLVYKLSAGMDADPPALWKGGPRNETMVTYLNTKQSPGPYVNRLPSKYWNAGGLVLSQARVAVYKNGEEQAALQFNIPAGQDNAAFFAQGNLSGTTWTDLKAANPNYFSLNGDGLQGRSWFISSRYAGCTNDAGWLVVDRGSGCSWETSRGPALRILHAPQTTAATWNDASVGVAETFAVFVR